MSRIIASHKSSPPSDLTRHPSEEFSHRYRNINTDILGNTAIKMAGFRKPPPIPDSPNVERLQGAVKRLRTCMEVDLARRVSYAKSRAEERRRASLNFVPSHRPRNASPLMKSVEVSQIEDDTSHDESVVVRRLFHKEEERHKEHESSDDASVIVRPSTTRNNLQLAQRNAQDDLNNKRADNLEKRKELFMRDISLLEQRCQGLAQESDIEFGDGAAWLEEVSAKLRRVSYKATGEMVDQLDELK